MTACFQPLEQDFATVAPAGGCAGAVAGAAAASDAAASAATRNFLKTVSLVQEGASPRPDERTAPTDQRLLAKLIGRSATNLNIDGRSQTLRLGGWRLSRLYTGPEPGEVAEWLKALAC